MGPSLGASVRDDGAYGHTHESRDGPRRDLSIVGSHDTGAPAPDDWDLCGVQCAACNEAAVSSLSDRATLIQSPNIASGCSIVAGVAESVHEKDSQWIGSAAPAG
jgi:hypothetical protein